MGSLHSGRKLGPELFLTIEKATVLHREVHALAFCSERIERLDFTNCLVHRRRTSQGMGELPSKLPFLAPILDLMRNQLTSCTNLVLDGNVLGLSDIDQLGRRCFRSGKSISTADAFCFVSQRKRCRRQRPG
jgi:hypothetical protein